MNTALTALASIALLVGCGSSSVKTNSSSTFPPGLSPTTALGNQTVPPTPATLPTSQAYDSLLPKVTGPPASTSSITVLPLDQPTEHALQTAFTDWEFENSNDCKVETIPGQVWLATDTNTGISYGVAAFQPQPGCGNGLQHGLRDIIVFSRIPQPPIGVFQRNPGGTWMISW